MTVSEKIFVSTLTRQLTNIEKLVDYNFPLFLKLNFSEHHSTGSDIDDDFGVQSEDETVSFQIAEGILISCLFILVGS